MSFKLCIIYQPNSSSGTQYTAPIFAKAFIKYHIAFRDSENADAASFSLTTSLQISGLLGAVCVHGAVIRP